MRVFQASVIVPLLILLPMGGCKQEKPAAMIPPPPKVTVAHPIVRDETPWDVYTGRLEAVEAVEVKARVSGFVESVTFVEGAIVKKGDVLYTIDPSAFVAQLDNAKAGVLGAKAKVEESQATLSLAQNDFKRAQDASKNGGVSIEEIDTRRLTVSEDEATLAADQAAVAAAQAAVEAAALNVEWCKVTAPISGRISDKKVTAGNLITGGAGTTTVLTTITSVTPIYCYVEADEAAVLKYQKLAREKKRASADSTRVACYMELANETGFPHTGVIDFVDNRIDPTTGTRRARGVVDNPDGTLLPGFFARLRVAGEEFKNAILVIDDAVGTDQDRKFIYVMHADKTIERRTVTVGPLMGELRVIESDLKPDELVLVNGISNLLAVRPGDHVDPTVVPMPENRLGEVAAATQAAASEPAATPSAGGPSKEGAR